MLKFKPRQKKSFVAIKATGGTFYTLKSKYGRFWLYSDKATKENSGQNRVMRLAFFLYNGTELSSAKENNLELPIFTDRHPAERCIYDHFSSYHDVSVVEITAEEINNISIDCVVLSDYN